MTFSHIRSMGWLVSGALILGGCGPDLSHLPPTVPAEGVVTLDGATVDGAQVVFIAENGDHAFAASDASGKFALRAFDEKAGALPGEYRVQVSKTIAEPTGKTTADGADEINFKFGVPKRYTGIGTSGLKVTIPAEGSTELKVELTEK